MSLVQSLIAAHRRGERVGLYSVCSSNDQVLRAAMDVAQRYGTVLLIEATSNQVDQFGGYTGMDPAAFRTWVEALARAEGFPAERLVLGGDHLGPNAWQARPAGEAMAHARDLVAAYAAAGFHKIHLDCSMSCAGDPDPLPDELVAARSAELAAVAERAAAAAGLPPPVYVIGTEVPVPGGETSLEGLAVTAPDAAARTLEIHRQAFDAPGLAPAWERVVAMVVQPGVDFDHTQVHAYDPAAAAALSDFVAAQPRIVFEAHSTDYQTEAALHALVRDHYAILKVGPAATFAYREALFALAAIEDALLPEGEPRSRLPEVLDRCMVEKPAHWQRHYAGDAHALRLLRRYALSDRCRYYWGEPEVQAAVERLVANLRRHPPPPSLLSQFLPEQQREVQAGRLSADPLVLVRHRIALRLAEYARACARNAAGRRGEDAAALS